MKYLHVICLALIGILLVGCSAGEAVTVIGDAIGQFFGASTPEGTPSPAVSLFGSIGPLLPGGLGVAMLGLSKMAHTALKTKDAYIESTKIAINNGSLVEASSEADVKIALQTAQNLHHNSKLLEKAYVKHKYGGVIKKSIDGILNILAKK